jgi:uncharacterized protein (DUF58 family)
VKRAVAVTAGGAALILVGLTFDASPLFVPGVAFTALGLATPAWIWFVTRGVTMTRRLHSARVLEDDPVEATIEVRRGYLGLPRAQVLDPLAGSPVPLATPLSLMRGGRSASVRVVAHFARRGRKQLEPPVLVVGDVLELAVVRRQGTADGQELLVLPRPERVNWASPEMRARLQHPNGQAAGEPLAAVELDGLRPYRSGTPASRIHWPALARGSGLLERRLLDDGDARPLVVLDPRCAEPDENLDAAIRAATSLTLELARRGGCGILLPGDRRPIELDAELGGWSGVHVRLALMEGGPDVRPPALGPSARSGRIFYIAAEVPQRTPQALSEGRLSGVLVIPRGLRSGMRTPPAFEVSGCVGFVLGSERRSARRARMAVG